MTPVFIVLTPCLLLTSIYYAFHIHIYERLRVFIAQLHIAYHINVETSTRSAHEVASRQQTWHLFLCFVNITDDLSAVALILCRSSKIAKGILRRIRWSSVTLREVSGWYVYRRSPELRARIDDFLPGWSVESAWRRMSYEAITTVDEWVSEWLLAAVKSDVRYDRLLYSPRDHRGANIFQLDSDCLPKKNIAKYWWPCSRGHYMNFSNTRSGEFKWYNSSSA